MNRTKLRIPALHHCFLFTDSAHCSVIPWAVKKYKDVPSQLCTAALCHMAEWPLMFIVQINASTTKIQNNCVSAELFCSGLYATKMKYNHCFCLVDRWDLNIQFKHFASHSKYSSHSCNILIHKNSAGFTLNKKVFYEWFVLLVC